MFTPSLRLEAAGLDPLVLSAASGYIPQSLDLGFPVVRDVTNNAPDADGTIDTTRHTGARNVTCSVVLDETISGVALWQMEQRIRAFMSPRLRIAIYTTLEPGGAELRLVARGSQWSSIVNARDHRPIVAQWVAPSGLIETAAESSVSGTPGDNQDQPGGASFPWSFDLSFGGSTPSTNGVLATNAGNVPVWPTITMYGPQTDPVVLNETSGRQLTFAGLTIAAGDFVRINFAEKTIENSIETSYYDTLDFPASEWWQLAPGDNRVFVVPATSTIPPAAFDVTWRSAWL